MDELKFFAGLTVITLVVIGLLIYFGLKLNKAVSKHTPEINFPLNITWTGNILYACVVTFWICCVAIRALRPESSFGAFLNSPDGVAAAIIGSLFFAAIAGAVLERIGYPIAKKGDKS
jgi:heme/copper-type cytochrome/quinol oxidase subunit 2